MTELLMSIGTLILYGGAVIGTNILSSTISTKSAIKNIDKKVAKLENPTPEEIAKINKKEMRKAKIANIAVTSVASVGLSAAATMAIESYYTPETTTEQTEDGITITYF